MAQIDHLVAKMQGNFEIPDSMYGRNKIETGEKEKNVFVILVIFVNTWVNNFSQCDSDSNTSNRVCCVCLKP